MMHSSRSSLRNRGHVSPATIESLESRSLFTATLAASLPGPIPASESAGVPVETNAGIVVKLANVGTSKFDGSPTITLYASRGGTYSVNDAQLGSVTKAVHIVAGSSTEVSVRVAAYPRKLDGHYYLLAKVVAPAQAVQCVSTTAVDIVPAYVDLSNQIAYVPATAQVGGILSITLHLIDQGTQAAVGTLSTLIEVAPSRSGTNPFVVATVKKKIDLNPAGAEILHLSVPVPLGSPSGKEFIIAVIDPDSMFNDPNFSNNTVISSAPVNFRS